MTTINLYAAWGGMLLGCLAGAGIGLFFRNEDWLGGYGSWRRRMLRLGHISFFGIGLINAVYSLSAVALGIEGGLDVPSVLLLVGAVTMPLVCYLSAVKDVFRHFFFIPALSVIGGIGVFIARVILR